MAETMTTDRPKRHMLSIRRLRLLALALLAVTVTATSSAQTPPLEFKGVPLDATRDELIAKLPGFECRTSYCQLEPERYADKLCGPIRPRQTDFKCSVDIIVGLRFGPTRPKRYVVHLRNDKVGNVEITYPSADYARLKIAITEKYGAPTTVESKPLQNRMGATFDNEVAIWRLSDGILQLDQRSGLVDEGVVLLQSLADAEASRRETIEKAKASAKSL